MRQHLLRHIRRQQVITYSHPFPKCGQDTNNLEPAQNYNERGNNSLEELLEMLDVRQHFAVVVGVDNVDKAKPDPEAILYILKSMHINACDALMVGDMPVDIAMGQNADVKTCAVTYGNSPREDLEKSHPDHLIDDFCQLLALSHLL